MSRRVPGVLACVVSGACSGVVWLVSGVVCSGVGVSVCVSWFRMLTCLASFFFLGFVLVLFVWLITVWRFVVVVGRVVWVGLVWWGYWVVVSCCSCLRAVNGVWACVCGVACASGCFW